MVYDDGDGMILSDKLQVSVSRQFGLSVICNLSAVIAQTLNVIEKLTPRGILMGKFYIKHVYDSQNMI